MPTREYTYTLEDIASADDLAGDAQFAFRCASILAVTDKVVIYGDLFSDEPRLCVEKPSETDDQDLFVSVDGIRQLAKDALRECGHGVLDENSNDAKLLIATVARLAILELPWTEKARAYLHKPEQ